MYPVVRIGWRVRRHITQLGEAAADFARALGAADAEFRIDHPGVWVGPRKLASIGVHVSRGITVQGIAINLDVQSHLFGALVSCGLAGVQMTSILAETGASPGVEDAARQYAEHWARHHGAAVHWTP